MLYIRYIYNSYPSPKALEFMSELNYTIDYDFLAKEYRIKWSHYLKYEKWLPSVKGWEIHWTLI